HRGAVAAASFSLDGKLAVTGSRDGTVRLWRPASGALVHAIRFGSPVEEVDLSRDARRLVAVGGGTARIFDTRTGSLLHKLGERGIITASFNRHADLVVTGSRD